MVVISLDSPSCGVCLFDPRTGGGGRARRLGGQREQEVAAQEVAGLALHGGVGAEQLRRGAEQASRQEEGEKGPICNF